MFVFLFSIYWPIVNYVPLFTLFVLFILVISLHLFNCEYIIVTKKQLPLNKVCDVDEFQVRPSSPPISQLLISLTVFSFTTTCFRSIPLFVSPSTASF